MSALAGAACARPGVDPEWFFPVGDPGAEERARAVCAGCPVRDACLAYAMEHAVQGIWAGTTTEERRDWRRARKAVARPVTADERPMWQQVVDMKAEGAATKDVADALGISYASAATLVSRYVNRPGPASGKGRRYGGPIEHGTTRGYFAHRHRQQPIPDGGPCGCAAAGRKYHRERKAARRPATRKRTS